MFYKDEIKNISCRQIFDLNGNDAFEISVITNSEIVGKVKINSSNENASKNIVQNCETISKSLANISIFNQVKIDNILLNLDGSEEKINFGAELLFAISMAVAKISAFTFKLSLAQYIGGISGSTMPCPIFNIISIPNVDNYYVIPFGFSSEYEQIKSSIALFKRVEELFDDEKIYYKLNEEKIYIPQFENSELVLAFIKKAINELNFATNSEKADKGFKVMNSLPKDSSILIPSEIGTLTEFIYSVRKAKENGIIPIVSLLENNFDESIEMELSTALNIKYVLTGCSFSHLNY